MRFALQYCCMMAMFLLPNLVMHAQSRIAKGAGIPQGLHDYDWYLDTIDGGLWWCEQNVWVHSSYSPADEILTCGKLTIIHKVNGYQAIHSNGHAIWPYVNTVTCLDTLLLMTSVQGLIFIETHDGRLASDNRHGYQCWDGNETPDTIGGRLAYCVVPRDLKSEKKCDDLRTWGMIGFNGHWLIEPKFDQPFRFQDGFAEVMYYGEKRKINEKGEFVE